jgi:hypothetical protein
MSLALLRLARDFNSLIGRRDIARDCALAIDAWEEEKHPRAENGQFGPDGGTSSGLEKKASGSVNTGTHINRLKKAKTDGEFSAALNALKVEKPTVAHLREIVQGVTGMKTKQSNKEQLLRDIQTARNTKMRDERRAEIASKHIPI